MGTQTLTAEKIRAALELSNGSVSEAARMLGVSRQTIHTRMREHGIVVTKVVGQDDGKRPA